MGERHYFSRMMLLFPTLAGLWVLAGLVLWIWHARRYRGLKSILEHPGAIPINEELKPLSLIICFHNEAENLKRLIPHWCEQKYPEFEVILVDDHSDDRGSEIVQKAQNQYSHLKLLDSLERHDRGKKAALRRGIIAAKNEALVFCDADCVPASPLWLKHLGSRLNRSEVVLGYGALQGKGFTGMLSDYETVSTALRYWSYAQNGKAYMGVGRNLAYHRSSMRAVQALSKHEDLLSGDDDLTLREMANDLKVACMGHSKSFTLSPAPKNLKHWWKQKGRHYSTAWRYASGVKFSLGLEGFLQLLFVILLPFAIWELPWYVVLGLFLGRWFFSAFPRKEHFPLIQHRWQALLWPFFEMVWAIATTLLHLRNLVLGPPKKW